MLHFPYPSESRITSLGVKSLLHYSQTSCYQPIILLLYLLKCLQLQSCLFENSIHTPVVEKLVNKLMQIDAGYFNNCTANLFSNTKWTNRLAVTKRQLADKSSKKVSPAASKWGITSEWHLRTYYPRLPNKVASECAGWSSKTDQSSCSLNTNVSRLKVWFLPLHH